jgi:hypothetical protein
MKKLLLISIVCLALGCNDNDTISLNCIRGEITGYEMCSNFLIMEVKDVPIGLDVEYYGKKYKNAIKVLADNTIKGVNFYRMREFDEEKDSQRAYDVLCVYLWAPAPADIPRYVVVAESMTTCP